MEEWCDISGFEGLYQVSNIGRVKSLLNGETVRIEDARHLFDDIFQKIAPQAGGEYIIARGDYQIVAEEEPEYGTEKNIKNSKTL